jgi:GntR family transcriptional regulator
MPDLENRLAARPLYLQVRDVLVQRIVVGQWKPGGTLPNETLLAQQLGISIGTVRKALDLMENERIVTRRQGRGTFVNDYSSDATFPYSTFHNMEGQRIAGHKRAKSVSRVAATPEEASRLAVQRGEELIRVERTREHLGRIFMTETCLLPARYFTRLPEAFESYRLSGLAQLNGILVSHADERVDVALASAEDALDLDVPEGAPVLRLDRVIFSDHDDPLEWRVARCCMRHERYMVRFV